MTLVADAPTLPTAFVAEQFWAAVSVIGVVAVLQVTARRSKLGPAGHSGLVTGVDNRYSTGRVVAVGWTLVVAWMVVTEAYIATRQSTTTFADLLSSASNLYFVLLGGPYAAAAFALLATQSKISLGTLTKTTADAPTAANVITDDNGNVDTYDFQYTLFNALAIIIVVVGFAAHPGHGLPDIPSFLAILTGGSALTYTVSKTTAADGPQITSVTPENAHVGDTVQITGLQLYTGQAGGPIPTVTIGGISATSVAIPPGTTNLITAVVAGPAAGTQPLSGPVDVVVTPPLGTPITLRGGVNIVPA